jgi:tetratricopeptide (TPR) repeat protein
VGWTAGLWSGVQRWRWLWIAAAVVVAGGAFGGFTQGGWWPLTGGAVTAGTALAASIWSAGQERRRAAVSGLAAALEPLVAGAASGRRPSELLLAEHRVVQFRGRAGPVQQVRDWLTAPGPWLLLLTGDVGVGKTRLTVEIAAAAAPGGWLAGWTVGRLRPGRESDALAAVRDGDGPVLVVVEAAAAGPGLPAFLASVQTMPASTRIRVLLVSRSELWVTAIRLELPETACAVLDDAVPLRLQRVGDRDDMVRWYTEAVEAFSGGTVAAGPTRQLSAYLSFADLHARALIRVLDANPHTAVRATVGSAAATVEGSSGAGVAAALAEHERRQWPRPPTAGVEAVVRERCVAVLTLLGVPGGPEAEAQAAAVLAAVPDVAADDGARRELARWIRQLYPGVGAEWIALPAPQLLARQLTLAPLLADRSMWLKTADQIMPERLTRVLGVLAAAAADHLPGVEQFAEDALGRVAGPPAGALGGWVAAVLAAGSPDGVDRLLERLVRDQRLTPETIGQLTGILDWRLPGTWVELHRDPVTRARAGDDPSMLAAALDRLRDALDRVGRYREALDAAEEAVGLYRDLVVDQPGLRSELAQAVRNLSVGLGRVGRYREALDAAEEAVGLYRDLVVDQPALGSDLARAVRNLAVGFDQVGRYGDALNAGEEAVGLYRGLVVDQPALRPDLAAAVASLAVGLDKVGRYGDALNATEDAVGLYRGLVVDQPALRRDLAQAMQNLAVGLSRMDRYGDALDAAEEAVGLYRGLVVDQPALRPGLSDAEGVYRNLLRRVRRDDQLITKNLPTRPPSDL